MRAGSASASARNPASTRAMNVDILALDPVAHVAVSARTQPPDRRAAGRCARAAGRRSPSGSDRERCPRRAHARIPGRPPTSRGSGRTRRAVPPRAPAGSRGRHARREPTRRASPPSSRHLVAVEHQLPHRLADAGFPPARASGDARGPPLRATRRAASPACSSPSRRLLQKSQTSVVTISVRCGRS